MSSALLRATQAAGSSAPELFTSLMGVFAVKNDVGIGTIVGAPLKLEPPDPQPQQPRANHSTPPTVATPCSAAPTHLALERPGSAVFNLCCIIGGTALFTPFVLKLDWKPITRDSIFYAISIAAMIVVLKDGQVTWIEVRCASSRVPPSSRARTPRVVHPPGSPRTPLFDCAPPPPPWCRGCCWSLRTSAT